MQTQTQTQTAPTDRPSRAAESLRRSDDLNLDIEGAVLELLEEDPDMSSGDQMNLHDIFDELDNSSWAGESPDRASQMLSDFRHERERSEEIDEEIDDPEVYWNFT